MNDFDKLKAFMKSIIDGDTPQKANIQGFSILVTYLVKNVRTFSLNKLSKSTHL